MQFWLSKKLVKSPPPPFKPPNRVPNGGWGLLATNFTVLFQLQEGDAAVEDAPASQIHEERSHEKLTAKAVKRGIRTTTRGHTVEVSHYAHFVMSAAQQSWNQVWIHQRFDLRITGGLTRPYLCTNVVTSFAVRAPSSELSVRSYR